MSWWRSAISNAVAARFVICCPVAGRLLCLSILATASTVFPERSPGGCALLISKGGETVEVNYLAGRPLAAPPDRPDRETDSTLGRMCDVVLCFGPSRQRSLRHDRDRQPAVQRALCDALCVVLLELRGYTKEQFGETHPGGAVGLRLASEGSER
jgi:arabinose-5-phosphate isomerase